MKVCFLNHNLREASGAGRFGLQLIGELLEALPDSRPVVLTAKGSGHPWEEAILYPNRPRLLWALPRIRKIFRGCDLIHALDGWPYGVIAAMALIGIEKPLVITAVGTGAIQPLHRWYGGLLRWAYRRANRVVAISEYTRREVLKKVPGLAIDVINHAVSIQEFEQPLWNGVSAGERSRIEAWKPYLLSVGSPKARKGFPYSLQAFAEIATEFPALRYVLVGSGGPAIREQVARPGLQERVIFLKHVPRPFLISLYRNAELFMLLPYDVDKDVEGFGFAFLEAAAAGLPVIGTRESGAEDAIADGTNGFLVPPRNPLAAAEALRRILGDRTLRARLVQGSCGFASRMNWEGVARAYRAIYGELSQRPR